MAISGMTQNSCGLLPHRGWCLTDVAFGSLLASIPCTLQRPSRRTLFVHGYGLAYAVAILAAVAIASRRWECESGDGQLVQEVAISAVPAGLIGGRLYFLATSWNAVPPHWWGPLPICDGGLGNWGGISAGTLAGLWILGRRGADILRLAPALLAAQAVRRGGNYFNQELFGGPTNLPRALEIDPAHRPLGYDHYATFHPTVL
jgi:prolipoprotein diacylglyceryltransferase